jgi:hypothetical protein
MKRKYIFSRIGALTTSFYKCPLITWPHIHFNFANVSLAVTALVLVAGSVLFFYGLATGQGGS